MYQQSIKTKCVIWAGHQKHQTKNLIKIPVGTIGKIKHRNYNNEYNLHFYLIKFVIDSKNYWAQVAITTFDLINS